MAIISPRFLVYVDPIGVVRIVMMAMLKYDKMLNIDVQTYISSSLNCVIQVYAGRANDTVGPTADHNCNGISGSDSNGMSFEEKFCSQTQSLGYVHIFNNWCYILLNSDNICHSWCFVDIQILKLIIFQLL